jgi:Ca2+-dependent lipid-binding protein
LKSSQEEGVDVPIGEINNATFNVYVRYIPVKYTVQPSESINNMGLLQISIKNAENLPAADRSGTSDPFIVFTLNNVKIYKTKTVKKNCNPEFNEDFNATVLSRIADVFEVEIFDWNQIGNAKKIASGKIQLDDLPAFERAVRKIQLNNELKSSVPGGVLNLHIVFRPEFAIKKKQGTGVTKTLTGIGTGISTGVGNVVSGGGSFVGSGINLVGSGASKAVNSGKNFGFSGLLKKNKENGDKEN